MLPRVSVIIAAYNHAAFLEEAVNSVLSQGFPSLEVFVVDDGSEDETAIILAELEERGVRHRRQARAGPAAARNAGVANTEGEWIAFLDADDLWLPGKLVTQLDELSRDPGAALCFGDVAVLETDGSRHSVTLSASGPPLFVRLLWGNCLATPTVLLRRRCFLEVGGFRPELQTGEDWDLWLRVAARHRCLAVRRELALVRRGAGSCRPSVEQLETSTLAVLREVFGNRELLSRWPEVARRRSRVYAWHYMVLAKSYARNGRALSALRMAAKSLRFAGLGLCPTA